MKFPESWLREFVDAPLAGEALADALTMAGLESEAVEPVAPPFARVVTACVLDVAAHPDADRLKVCRVDVGGVTPLRIVCGAPNVVPGMRTACALTGAILPGGVEIQRTRVRGVESEGMLCSARELGISGDDSGLLELPEATPPGENLRAVLELDDLVHTLKMTPNRGDCQSLVGIAREVAAITGCRLTIPAAPEVSTRSPVDRGVSLMAPEACPRYTGRVVTGVNAMAKSPDWMRRRLERGGLRSISALVDITNYVMLESGQPLHAFDNARLEGDLQVRFALPRERLQLLNGQTLELDADVLMIADAVKPLAMAGVMGGEESGVSLATQDVFLESAFFAPEAIAGRARRYGFGSDAAHRFERGVDFAGTLRALDRATGLILEICGGSAGPVAEATGRLPVRSPIGLRLSRLERVLGVSLSRDDVLAVFERLGMPATLAGDVITVVPPPFRFDLAIEEDLIEEVARLRGYDRIPSVPPRAMLTMLPHTETARTAAQIRSAVVARGYQEVINFAFVDRQWESDFCPNAAPIVLANPISSQASVMRTSLLGGLVGNLGLNIRRKQSRVRIFEIGRCFSRISEGGQVPGFAQPRRLAGLAWGSAIDEQWGGQHRGVDFFDVKRDVEILFGEGGVCCDAIVHPAFHPGRGARVIVGSRSVGIIGELHPQWVQKYELGTPPVLFELELDPLLEAAPPRFSELSNFPQVSRDLAVVVANAVELRTVLAVARSAADPIVRDIHLFDVYTGKGIEIGKKSLAFRIVMQDTQKTLQDAEVDAAMQKIASRLDSELGAKLRA